MSYTIALISMLLPLTFAIAFREKSLYIEAFFEMIALVPLRMKREDGVNPSQPRYCNELRKPH